MHIDFKTALGIKCPRILHWRQIPKNSYTTLPGLPRSQGGDVPPVINQELSEANRAICRQMASACAHLGGIGFAAPQMGEPLAIICLRDEITEVGGVYTFLFNPEWKPLATEGNEKTMEYEACLSVPDGETKGLKPIERYRAIETFWYDYNETEVRFELKRKKLWDHEARVFQHEVDHLWGRSIVDRSNGTRIGSNRKAKRPSKRIK